FDIATGVIIKTVKITGKNATAFLFSLKTNRKIKVKNGTSIKRFGLIMDETVRKNEAATDSFQSFLSTAT
ncbi:MAG TPA: hypothetical protein VLJ60_10075, partial [bacterium]|nr:hypothetical protein [bacterium]